MFPVGQAIPTSSLTISVQKNWDGFLFLWCFLVPSGHSSTRNTGEQSEPKPSITICTNKYWHPTWSAFFMACGQFCLIRWHRFSEISGFPTDFLDILGNRRPKRTICLHSWRLRQVAGRQVDSQSLRPHVFLNTEIFTSCLASPTVCRNSWC